MTNSSRIESAQQRVVELTTDLIEAREAAAKASRARKGGGETEAAAADAAKSRVALLVLELKQAQAEEKSAKKAQKDQPEVDLKTPTERLRKRYVYCAMRDEVWDRNAGDWIQLRALDNLETVNMPTDEKGRRLQPWSLLRADPRADRVHNERYMPGVEDEIATADGVQ